MTDIKPYITDIGIAVAGSVDSGKSTFVGVLTTGKLDDGDGSARLSVAKHPHEVESKKTSDITTKSLITKNNSAVTLFDLCGHEKYFKSTAYGISGYFPDYSFLIVGANKGILPMTKQHITLLLSMNIPIIIIVTRYDITPQHIYQETIKMVQNYCRNIIKIPAEIINSPYIDSNNIESFKQEKIKYFNSNYFCEQNRQISVPVITVSNKTGYYIDYINDILSVLKPRNIWKNFDDDSTKQIEDRCVNRIIKKFINVDKSQFLNPSNNSEHVFFIDMVYNPIGIGIVVSGINRGGTINVGDTLLMGPFGKDFKEIRIKSMNNYVKQKIMSAGDHQRITIAIGTNDKDITKQSIRRGMILIKSKDLIKKYLTWRFDAVITLFSHSATLKTGYAPSLQIGHVRQSGRMVLNKDLNDDKDHIKIKEFANITFKFKQRPEYIEPFQTFIFRSGCVHGVGVITNVIPLINDVDGKPDPLKSRFLKYTK